MGGGTGTRGRPRDRQDRARNGHPHRRRGDKNRSTSRASAAWRTAESGIAELHKVVDTLLIIPKPEPVPGRQREDHLRRRPSRWPTRCSISGVACITDLMVKEGLINLDFADVRAVMREMGKAMMGTGEATGEKRAMTAAEAAIAKPA